MRINTDATNVRRAQKWSITTALKHEPPASPSSVMRQYVGNPRQARMNRFSSRNFQPRQAPIPSHHGRLLPPAEHAREAAPFLLRLLAPLPRRVRRQRRHRRRLRRARVLEEAGELAQRALVLARRARAHGRARARGAACGARARARRRRGVTRGALAAAGAASTAVSVAAGGGRGAVAAARKGGARGAAARGMGLRLLQRGARHVQARRAVVGLGRRHAVEEVEEALLAAAGPAAAAAAVLVLVLVRHVDGVRVAHAPLLARGHQAAARVVDGRGALRGRDVGGGREAAALGSGPRHRRLTLGPGGRRCAGRGRPRRHHGARSSSSPARPCPAPCRAPTPCLRPVRPPRAVVHDRPAWREGSGQGRGRRPRRRR